MVRKPADIDEVMELCRRYALQIEEVVVAETVELPAVWYDAVCLIVLCFIYFIHAMRLHFIISLKIVFYHLSKCNINKP